MCRSPRLHAARAVAALTLVLCAAALAGCASDSGVAGAFADPAAFNLYDCQQLAPRRASLAARETQLHGLMAKAQEGAGGALISEVAYRSDLLTVQGQRQYADQAWIAKGCERDMTAGAPRR